MSCQSKCLKQRLKHLDSSMLLIGAEHFCFSAAGVQFSSEFVLVIIFWASSGKNDVVKYYTFSFHFLKTGMNLVTRETRTVETDAQFKMSHVTLLRHWTIAQQWAKPCSKFVILSGLLESLKSCSKFQQNISPPIVFFTQKSAPQQVHSQQ